MLKKMGIFLAKDKFQCCKHGPFAHDRLLTF